MISRGSKEGGAENGLIESVDQPEVDPNLEKSVLINCDHLGFIA
jgi:hypothetical protein